MLQVRYDVIYQWMLVCCATVKHAVTHSWCLERFFTEELSEVILWQNIRGALFGEIFRRGNECFTGEAKSPMNDREQYCPRASPRGWPCRIMSLRVMIMRS